MQWTLHPEGHRHESPRQKTSSQEETVMIDVSEEVGKGGYHEDPYRETVQGKSSNASSAINPVTLQEIADRNAMAIKDHLAPDKPKRRKQLPHDKSLTKEPLNRGPQIGCQE
jgi:hypothetical protein